MRATGTFTPGGAPITIQGHFFSNGVCRVFFLPLLILGGLCILYGVFSLGTFSSLRTATNSVSAPATYAPASISVPSQITVSAPGLENRVDTLTLGIMSAAPAKPAVNGTPAEKSPEQRLEDFRKYLREHQDR